MSFINCVQSQSAVLLLQGNNAINANGIDIKTIATSSSTVMQDYAFKIISKGQISIGGSNRYTCDNLYISANDDMTIDSMMILTTHYTTGPNPNIYIQSSG